MRGAKANPPALTDPEEILMNPDGGAKQCLYFA
jgi:hypothetical protein